MELERRPGERVPWKPRERSTELTLGGTRSVAFRAAEGRQERKRKIAKKGFETMKKAGAWKKGTKMTKNGKYRQNKKELEKKEEREGSRGNREPS